MGLVPVQVGLYRLPENRWVEFGAVDVPRLAVFVVDYVRNGGRRLDDDSDDDDDDDDVVVVVVVVVVWNGGRRFG